MKSVAHKSSTAKGRTVAKERRAAPASVVLPNLMAAIGYHDGEDRWLWPTIHAAVALGGTEHLSPQEWTKLLDRLNEGIAIAIEGLVEDVRERRILAGRAMVREILESSDDYGLSGEEGAS